MEDFEKLGVFYLGKRVAGDQLTEDLVLYDSRDLTTHAVCVGMTGSGKTGLCIGLLEEAAIDGIPSIVIDPKGDIGNLLLHFPSLRPDDFRPWISADEAARKNLSAADFAAAEANRWEQGLRQWGQDPSRIERLAGAAEFSIYTPGSSAGLPVSVLKSFSPPKGQALDADLLRERIQTSTSGLLGLVGIDADPLQSREHILIANILSHAQQTGTDLDLPQLIEQIQKPPFDRIGVFGLNSFFPESDRLKLAIKLNNLLAAPTFSAWLEGDPFNIDRMLYGESGKPKVSIFSIAHLSDAERMFFVTLLLNEVLGWMRTQSGTTSLRALLYMDEIFGYFPPVAEPPSKKPLLTLLKQARAFGLGVVLATQNPVDLDYKGLSNAGTWFVGRLQTENDKQRLLDGLSGLGTGGKLDLPGVSDLLSQLGKRVFLLHNVHEEAPVLFQTRWVLSYLRGPLTRAEIATLMRDRKRAVAETAPPAPAPAAPVPAAPAEAGGETSDAPHLSPDLPQFYAYPEPGQPARVYRPCLFATAQVEISNSRMNVRHSSETFHVLPLADDLERRSWMDSEASSLRLDALSGEPLPGFPFAPDAAGRLTPDLLETWEKDYESFLASAHQLTLWKSDTLKTVSQPEESERDFRIRLSQLAREKRDEAVDKLRERYASRIESAQKRLLTARQRLEREEQQLGQQKAQTIISIGSTLLGALLGRRALGTGSVGRATTAARGAMRTQRERQDVERAEREVERISDKLSELEEELREEIEEISAELDPALEKLEEVVLRPGKRDIRVRRCGLLWVPSAG